MITGLVLVAVFFVTQTWLAAMLVPGTDPVQRRRRNNAFFGIVGTISGSAWMVAFLAMNALAVGIANAVAAQSATSRLLFSMSRDGRLPRFLAHIDPKSKAPQRAILVVAGLTLVLGLVFVGQIDIISTAGQLRRADRLPAAARLGDRLLRGQAAQQERLPALDLAGPRLPDHRLRAWNADASAKIGGVIWLASARSSSPSTWPGAASRS